jgi:hypothetical protein
MNFLGSKPALNVIEGRLFDPTLASRFGCVRSEDFLLSSSPTLDEFNFNRLEIELGSDWNSEKYVEHFHSLWPDAVRCLRMPYEYACHHQYEVYEYSSDAEEKNTTDWDNSVAFKIFLTFRLFRLDGMPPFEHCGLVPIGRGNLCRFSDPSGVHVLPWPDSIVRILRRCGQDRVVRG